MILSIPSYSQPPTVGIVFLWIFVILLGLLTIAGIIAFISFVIDAFKGDEDGCQILFAFVIEMVLGVCFVGVIFVLVSVMDSNNKYQPWYESELEEVRYSHIYSLNLHDNVSGQFHIGHGKVETKSYYYFYVNSKYDSYQLAKIEITDSVYIKESSDTPKVVERKDANSEYIYTIIYVPSGTIIDANFNMV